MTENWTAIAMVFVGLFLVGGVISFVRQGLRLGAAMLGVGAALALTAGVLWW
ncbi:hypothetical protein GCM10010106_07210 [Thermopolyspora flexuosa]|uniref:Amidotransferase n=1 Tax=Thermopolyspora flexuosa TaxID=103836 RepID=A0A543IZJ2_9ACTN|nr:hypothetical protein [Thermopolyspora flexuosa]TQM75994.1 hypothetical protein FHX40_2718 [Thermopolyspora flexuosa]GGM63818.1 hypothetical protein GCM10010106_07210 [Thermopolyspora flexuosa]